MTFRLSELTVEQAAATLACRALLSTRTDGFVKRADLAQLLNDYVVNPQSSGARALQGTLIGTVGGGAAGLLSSLFEKQKRRNILQRILRGSIIGGGLGLGYGVSQPFNPEKGYVHRMIYGSKAQQTRDEYLRNEAERKRIIDEEGRTPPPNPIKREDIPDSVERVIHPNAGLPARVSRIGDVLSGEEDFPTALETLGKQMPNKMPGIGIGAGLGIAGYLYGNRVTPRETLTFLQNAQRNTPNADIHNTRVSRNPFRLGSNRIINTATNAAGTQTAGRPHLGAEPYSNARDAATNAAGTQTAGRPHLGAEPYRNARDAARRARPKGIAGGWSKGKGLGALGMLAGFIGSQIPPWKDQGKIPQAQP